MFDRWSSCEAAIAGLHGKTHLEGAKMPLVVKFADAKVWVDELFAVRSALVFCAVFVDMSVYCDCGSSCVCSSFVALGAQFCVGCDSV